MHFPAYLYSVVLKYSCSHAQASRAGLGCGFPFVSDPMKGNNAELQSIVTAKIE